MARISSYRFWLVPLAILLAAVRCGGGDSVTLPSDKLPAKLTIESGNAQQGAVGVRLTDTLIVRVTDTKNGPVSPAKVVFQRLAGGTGGAVIPDTAVTDVDGLARSIWVLGRLAGPQSVVVRVVPPVSGAPLSVTFSATGLAGTPDTIFAALGDRQTGQVGATLSDSLAVLVTDQFGNPVAGQTVNWSVPAGQGSVSAAAVVTGSDGRAAVQRRLGPSSGSQTATAVLIGVKGSTVIFTSTASAGGAVRAVKLFGDLQTAPAGFQLTDSVVVQVQDVNGNGVPNRNVNWVVTDGGSATPLTSTTDAQGKAFAYWTLKPTAGANQLTAAASGLTQLQFSATGTSATPAQISAQSSTTIAGTAGLGVTQKPSVKVTDANSNPVQGVTVTFLVTAGGGTVSDGTGNGPSASVATNASGVATLTSWTLGTVAGAANSVTATAAGPGISGNPITFNATAAAGAATRLLISTQPSAGAQSGAPFGQQPVVQLRDGFGNAVLQAGIQVTATVIGSGATLRGTATVSTSSTGAATFGGLNLFGAAGSYSLGFAASGLGGDTSTVIALTAGAAARLALTTQPAASAQSGVPFATQPVLQVQDSAGNPVAAGGIQVAAAIATGGGTLGGTTPVATTAGGSAAFTNLSITGSSGPRTLSFSAAGLAAAVSGTVTLGAGAPTALGMVTQPSSSAQSGSVFAQQPVVVLQDAIGNPVNQAGVSVTVAITGAPAGVTLGGNPTVLTTASGTASFSGLSLAGPAGSYTLSFTVTAGASGVAGVTSSAMALAAGSGTALTITTQPPAAGQSGVALTPAAVIQLRDGVGNAVNQAGVAVIATIASGASGTLTGTDTALTSATGTATFSNLVISGTVGSYTLAFGGSGLTGVTASATTIGAGPAAKLALSTQPAPTAQSGIILTTQPVLQLQDGAGNPVSQAGVVITAAIATGGGTLGGTLTATTGANGQGSFTDLAISGTVGVRTLGFSAPALTGVTSGGIALSAGAAAAIAKVAGDGQSATAGSPVATDPQVKVTDASGNPVSGFSVSFAVASGGGSVGAAAPTDVNGLTSATWTLGTSTGANTLTANAALTGGPTSVTFSATGTAGTAGRLAIITQPSATAANGAVFAQQPVIQLQDQNGNNVTTSNVAITAQSSGTLGGNVTALTVNGVATFTNLSLSGTVGTYALNFTGSNLTGVTSSAISLTPGAPVALVMVTQPGTIEQSGIPLGQQPVLQVVDAAGNAVATSGRLVTAAINTGPGGSVSPSGRQVSTNANGTATFTTLTLTGPVGSYTLLFSASGLAATTTASFTLAAGNPATITANSATSQSATVGTPVGTPPSVLVVDGVGNPVMGVTVTFAVTAGGGSLNGATQATDAAGVATVTSWTLGGTAGANTVTATAAGGGIAGNPVSFTATGTAGGATTIAVNGGNNQSAAVNANVATAPSVKVTDAGGNPVANVSVTFAVGSGGGSITGATASTNALGVAAVGSWTLGTAAGPNALTATSGTLTNSPITFSATATPGAAATIIANAGDGQSAQVGNAVPIPPQVLVTDAFGNPKSGVTVTFAVASGGGSLTGGTTTSNASGLATVGSWTLGSVAGANTLTATATGSGISGNPVTFTATATSGGATSVIANSLTTQTATVGTAVAAAPSVLVRDAVNNPVAGATVSFAITAGPAGILVGGTQTTNAQGIATVTSWTVDTTARANTVTATVSGSGISGNPVSFNATGTAGVAARVIMNRQPSTSVQSGVIFPITPRVQVADQYNNAVATPVGVVITGSVLTSPGGTPVLTNGTATTSTTGLATFTNFTVGGPTGGYTFQFDATASGLGTVASNGVTVTPGPATTLSFTTQPPANAASGTAFSSPPVLQLRDAAGNAVTSSGIGITATIASGPTGGSLGNFIATTVNGAATFTGLTLTGTAGSYTLSFSGSSLTPVTSTSIALTAGGGSQLGITTQPSSSATNGQPFAQQPVIQLKDGSGNPVSQAGVSVVASINSGAGATLGGTLTQVTNASGQATFTNLALTGTTGNFSLLFSTSGYVSVGSSTISLTAGAPSSVTMSLQPSTSAQNTVAFATQPVAVVRDQSSNPVPSTGVTASIATGAGTLGGNLTVFTDGAGVATFGTLQITGLIGSRTLKLTAGVANGTTGSINITAGPVSGAQSTGTVPATGTVGVPTSISVQARDVSGNPLTVGGATVVISVSGNNSAVPAVTDNGNGTYSASYTPAAAGSDNVAILISGSPISGSPFATTVGSGGSSTSISSVSPSSSVTGQAYTVNFTVTASGATPTGTVTVSDGAATCNGSLSGGAGSCQLTSTTAGAKSLVATYGGDVNHGGSTSAGVAHTVNQAATVATITGDNPDPSSVDSPYTVTFTVVAAAPGSGTPTGNVTVSDGLDSCTGTVAAGTCSLTSTTSGNKTLTASYAGDADFLTSLSAGVAHNVNKHPTTTTITANTPNPSVVGQGVLVSYSIGSTGPGSPAGNVIVDDGAGATCTGTVATGSCTLIPTTAGTRTLTATYQGSSKFGGSISAGVSQTVNQAATTATVTGDTPDPSTVGSAYTVSFTIVAAAPGSGTPTGNVTVSDGTDSCIGTVAAGSCSLTSTTTGAKSLTASYAGDVNYSSSTSAGVGHTVGTAPTTTAITADTPDPSVVGQQISVSVTVTSGFGTPTGSVTVGDGTDGCTIAALSGGAGACSFTPTTSGAKTLTATYAGDPTHASSFGTAPHQVDPFGTAVALRYTVQPSDVAQLATITPAVEVEIIDGFGNRVTSAGNTVTIAIANDPNGGTSTLLGTLSAAASSGVASFGDLSITLPGTGFTLGVTASGLSGATSSTFDVQ